MERNSSSITQLALVSPCSTCHNQRAFAAQGKPACPRRYWAARQKEGEASNEVEPEVAPLLRTGNENVPSAPADALRNPVYWDQGHSILVWVATLRDNRAIINDDTGRVINPDILDAGFDTDFIQCQHLPYVPEASEADYFQSGRMKEGQLVRLAPVDTDQKNLVTNFPAFVGGTARRTNLLNFSHRLPVPDHDCPEGC